MLSVPGDNYASFPTGTCLCQIFSLLASSESDSEREDCFPGNGNQVYQGASLCKGKPLPLQNISALFPSFVSSQWRSKRLIGSPPGKVDRVNYRAATWLRVETRVAKQGCVASLCLPPAFVHFSTARPPASTRRFGRLGQFYSLSSKCIVTETRDSARGRLTVVSPSLKPNV